MNPAIYAKLPYDTLKDFIEISPLAIQPNVLVVNSTSPWLPIVRPGRRGEGEAGLDHPGHAGVGSGTHLSTGALHCRFRDQGRAGAGFKAHRK